MLLFNGPEDDDDLVYIKHNDGNGGSWYTKKQLRDLEESYDESDDSNDYYYDDLEESYDESDDSNDDYYDDLDY